MEIEKQIIKTYSRRQPITRYESCAVLVPNYTNPTQVRESRLNDKTLMIDNFDDTFDRLATGVVVPSPENSLDENGVDSRKRSDTVDIFKMPLQAKKKPIQKEKLKKKDMVPKAIGVKRKNVVIDSDDSNSSDQEETCKKQVDNKKSKEKIKKVVKRKKNMSTAKAVVGDKLVANDSVNENASDNFDDKAEKSTNTDNFKKSIEGSVNQHEIQRYFQASTPRVNKIQTNIDMQNLSPVIMDTANKRVLHLSIDEEHAENAAHDKHNRSENFNQNVECNQSNTINTNDNFAKPREFTKVDLLKTFKHLCTSTPRVNKICMPVNLQYLSPIASTKEKRITGNEKSSTVDADTKNEQNSDMESNFNDVQVLSELLVESVQSPTKLNEIEHSVIKESNEPLYQEKSYADHSKHQELPASNIQIQNNNRDESINGNGTSESTVGNQDDSLLNVDDRSNTKQFLSENTQNYDHSPLIFDDSVHVQNELGKSNVVADIDKVNDIEINFNQNFSNNIEQKNKELGNSKTTDVDPPISKNNNFNISTESSFFPDDWTNDYDSTYGYEQLKNNLEKDNTVDSKLIQDKIKNSFNGSENTNISETNVTEDNEGLNMFDNTELQSVKDYEQEKAEDTHYNGNVFKNRKNELDEQEKYHNDLNISNKDYHDSTNLEKDNIQNSQITVEGKQFLHSRNKSTNEDNHDSIYAEEDIQRSQVTIEEKQLEQIEESKDVSLLNQQNGSSTLSIIENLDDFISPGFTARPSKRRKVDTNEIPIFHNLKDDEAHVQNEKYFQHENNRNVVAHISMPEDSIGESVNIEPIENTNSANPDQQEENSPKLPDKVLQIVLSRTNKKYESPILSQEKLIKKTPAKYVSEISEDSNDESFSKEKKQSNTIRVTRRSVSEDKMRQLYVQYQCKNLAIYAVRIEDQKVNLPLTRSLKRKSIESSISKDNELDNSLTNGRLSEFLSKLNDPVKVAMRRKTQKKYDMHLAAINENQAGQNSEDVNGKKIVTWSNGKRVTFNERGENSKEIEYNGYVSQPIFLKPGKSWARSLSIINHFHNGKNLDELAAGRENWRHSVQTILNMQPEVSGQNNLQNHEETRRKSRASRVSTRRESKSMRKSSIASNSRSSMRIIPSGKMSTLTNDLMNSQRISYVSDRSRASKKMSLKIQRDTLIETEDDLIRSAKDIILKRCKQTSYESFDVCFPNSYIENCRKIGEGVYGEVFLYENGSEKSVIKIIPIEGDQLVNCEPQKKFHEILSEIIIAEELHKLRSNDQFHTNDFVEVNRIMCVIGKYPEKLINLWDAYDEAKKSENDRPSMFEKNQLYIILELAHGGQDLEAYTFQNASESYAIFLQTALTLAVAEQSLEFEHRDLHWGNLLISKTKDKDSTYKLGNKDISLSNKGVKVTVIDFTLSRMSYQGCNIFNDLSTDPTLFEAQGEYQFDIYRMMRDNVNDDWQQFNPFTNILWLDYILDKMITAVRYKKKTTKIHKNAIEEMKILRKEILYYSSAFDFVTNCKKVQTLFDSI
ncbi:uncharacterized protein MAL13P1.304 [Phymastichus coffea]|uniref:uncharacterized protein MAL13P1.304 n=1 Tax=Phymastichus coffea TaxID=108790 RepID=UPI00273CC8AD|nr:uncharacterized protein MAL13P1.304 [Phymastichus coffea]